MIISEQTDQNANSSTIRTQIKRESHSIEKYNWEAFLLDLQGVDWEMAISTARDDPNIMANKFCDLFHSILDALAPIKI